MRPRRDGQTWTPSERQSLHVAASDFSLRWADIGRLMGRTGHACMLEARKEGWVPRFKLGKKPTAPPRQSAPVMRLWTDDDKAQLRADWANPDISRKEIAAKHGRTDQAIAHKAYQMRLGRKARYVVRPTLKSAERIQLSADYRAELLRRGISQQTIDMMGRE